jgi:hypothetical protein
MRQIPLTDQLAGDARNAKHTQKALTVLVAGPLPLSVQAAGAPFNLMEHRLMTSKDMSSAAAPEQGRLQLVNFNGMALPGRMAKAKATGFTECTAGYDVSTCLRTSPTQLLGRTAQTAELTLDGKDHFAELHFVLEKHSGDLRKILGEELVSRRHRVPATKD